MSLSDLDGDLAMPITDDVFLGGQLQVRQPARGYRAGLDAVLLAAMVAPDAADGRMLDLGAGVGTVGLCVAVRCPGAHVVLLEREPSLVALARQNVEFNRLGARVTVLEADITKPTPASACAGLRAESFDRVLANPPYYDAGAGTAADAALKAASHQMPSDDLESWVRFMARMTRPGGRATMIHLAEALPRILSLFERRFGGMAVLPIYAHAGEKAIRVMVEGIKGSRAPMILGAGLVLHGPDQKFMPNIDAALRHGAALQS